MPCRSPCVTAPMRWAPPNPRPSRRSCSDIGNSMTDTALAAPRRMSNSDALVARRYRSERRFKFYGIAAIAVTAIFLVLLFADILVKGLPAFFEHRMTLPIKVDQAA